MLGVGGTSVIQAQVARAAVPKTLYVSARAKSDPACSAASSLRPFATIAGALACAQSGDTVRVGAGWFGGGFTVSSNVVLEGAGADKTMIADPPGIGAEVTTAAGTSVTIEDLTINGQRSTDATGT